MKLATSTNIMDADCNRPYQIPVDVSARACAHAGYQYVDACLCSYCREALGVEWMVVHPYSVSRHGGDDYRRSYAYNVEYWKRWGDFYAQHHVGMAIENMNRATQYGSCAEELLELIDAVDNPAVQICIDTGHANMVGLDVPAMIRQVGTHLKATHINDNHGKTDEHFAPYNGTIPWKETVQALRDIGYQECFAFEIHHLTSMYPKEVQPAQVDFSYALGSYLLRE